MPSVEYTTVSIKIPKRLVSAGCKLFKITRNVCTFAFFNIMTLSNWYLILYITSITVWVLTCFVLWDIKNLGTKYEPSQIEHSAVYVPGGDTGRLFLMAPEAGLGKY